jgi:hypothetical protein
MDKPVLKVDHLCTFSCTLGILCSIHACVKLGFYCVQIPYRSLSIKARICTGFVLFTLTVLLYLRLTVNTAVLLKFYAVYEVCL